MSELPLSLSIVTAEGMTVKMLERGSAIPSSKTRMFTTYRKIPSAIKIELVLGERKIAGFNRRIAVIRLAGIRKTVGNIVRVAVKVETWADGRILFEAFDYGSHKKKTKIIKEGWLPENEEIFYSVRGAEESEEEENEIIERCRVLNKARNLLMNIHGMSKEDKAGFTSEELKTIAKKAGSLTKRVRRLKVEKMTELDMKVLNEYITSIKTIIHKYED